MITQRALNYGKVLNSLQVKKEVMDAADKLLNDSSALIEVLENPVIKRKEKYAVINDIFEPEIVNFMKLLCDHNMIGAFGEIKEAYDAFLFEQRDIIKAKLRYATRPQDVQLEQIKSMLCQKYNKKEVFLELVEDASLIGGFVLYAEGTEFDKSIKGALSELQKTLIGRWHV